ncbi:MAG: AbrB/MazE/SpoVT family DNA-binding domain-containing protein [Chloroflexi bacterium]|nr:AbrB/MazE/SpoVT family DNA-binding domain-containing protein [Chloroflexota bacterium]
MAATKLVRIQDKGQVTLPAAVRRQLGLKKGDLIAVTTTPDGVLLIPQAAVAMRALDQIGEIVREQRLTLEELIESGREERAGLIKARYGDLARS